MNAMVLLLHVLLSVGVVALPASLAMRYTVGRQEQWYACVRSPLTPPGIVFSVVWSVLYVLIGVCCYLPTEGEEPARASVSVRVAMSGHAPVSPVRPARAALQPGHTLVSVVLCPATAAQGAPAVAPPDVVDHRSDCASRTRGHRPVADPVVVLNRGSIDRARHVNDSAGFCCCLRGI